MYGGSCIGVLQIEEEHYKENTSFYYRIYHHSHAGQEDFSSKCSAGCVEYGWCDFPAGCYDFRKLAVRIGAVVQRPLRFSVSPLTCFEIAAYDIVAEYEMK